MRNRKVRSIFATMIWESSTNLFKTPITIRKRFPIWLIRLNWKTRIEKVRKRNLKLAKLKETTFYLRIISLTISWGGLIMAISTKKSFFPHKPKAINPRNLIPSVLHSEKRRKSPKIKPNLIKTHLINNKFSRPFWA